MPAALSSSTETAKSRAKESIKQRARSLGFDDCRVTSAEAPDPGNRFAQWLADGKHGEMGYLLRNAPKRMDVQKVLPGAKSVVTLAVSYKADSVKNERKVKTPDEPSAKHATRNTQRGSIARYAQFGDYHDIISPQ